MTTDSTGRESAARAIERAMQRQAILARAAELAAAAKATRAADKAGVTGGEL